MEHHNACEVSVPATVTDLMAELNEIDIDGTKLSVKVIERGKSTKICHYYQKGRCEKGDNCRFLHIRKNNNSRKNNGAPSTEGNDIEERRTCRFFMKGKCKRGGQCRFKHPQCRKLSRKWSWAENEPYTYGERCKFGCYKDEHEAEQEREQQQQILASNEHQSSRETPVGTAPVRKPQPPPFVSHTNMHDNLNNLNNLNTCEGQQSKNTSHGGLVSKSQNNESGEETFLGKR